MKCTHLVLILVSCAMAACATPEQRARHMIEVHGPTCAALGFTRDTDPWRNCILRRQASIEADDSPVVVVPAGRRR